MTAGEQRSDGQGSDERPPAGPVPAGDPPPPPVAKASSGAVPPTGPPAGEPSDQVEEDLDALLADAEAKKDEYLEIAKRAQADFENYRKRMAAEVQAASGRGKAELARELIDPVDNLERALAAAGIDAEAEDPLAGGAGEVKDPEGLAHGVLLVFHGLQETLRRHGIESVNPKGQKFDPTIHEAISTQQIDTANPGIIVEVLQKGYRMGDQLIRPARVVVSA